MKRTTLLIAVLGVGGVQPEQIVRHQIAGMDPGEREAALLKSEYILALDAEDVHGSCLKHVAAFRPVNIVTENALAIGRVNRLRSNAQPCVSLGDAENSE